MNIYTTIGNLGADAKMVEVNGRTVINFSIAENSKKVDSDGVITEKTTWIGCSLWRDMSKSKKLMQYLKKGKQVMVSGIMDLRPYNDKNGVAQVNVNLKVDQLLPLSAKDESEEQEEDNTKQRVPAMAGSDLPEDDIPF